MGRIVGVDKDNYNYRYEDMQEPLFDHVVLNDSSSHYQIEFNMNDNVKIKLTNEGFKILAEYWGGEVPEWFYENYDLGDGFYKFQLHQLAHIFGKYTYNGNTNLPFETTIYLIFEEVTE